MGGGFSSSKSKSENRIDSDQKRFLKDLWARARGQTNQFGPQDALGVSQGLVDQFMPGAQQGAGTFGNIAAGTAPGQDLLLQNAQASSPWLDQSISDLGFDIGRNLNENILPALQSGGIAAGAPGGSRTQIAQGLAAQEAQRTFGQQSTQLRAQDLLRQQAAAQAFTGNQLAGAQGSVGSAGALYNLGFSPFNAQYLPLQQYSAALGNPTMIGDSNSKSFSMQGGMFG